MGSLESEYHLALEQHLRRFYGDELGLPETEVEAAVRKREERERGEAFAATVDEYVGLRGKELLDIGCGWGELLLACRERGANAVGIEPDEDEVAISRLLLRSHDQPDDLVTHGFGERLPYSSETFDVITCQQVLEHVNDITVCIREMVRVLKRDGSIIVSTPNYLFPYEGHYRMKWVPFTPKRLGALVLRARGRNPDFLLHRVNYVTYHGLSLRWRRHGLKARNLTSERVKFNSHPSGIYRSRFVRHLTRRLGLFPNVTWLLTKRSARVELGESAIDGSTSSGNS